MVLEADLHAGRLAEPHIKQHNRKDSPPMRTTLARILLVPAVAMAAIASVAPAAQAAPPTSAQSTLYNDSGQWGGDGQGHGHYGYHANDGLLETLFECGLLSLLLGGCDQNDWN
jgi:hypothetical protein